MADLSAILLEREGRSVLRFERLLGHPPERVWRALTEPGELDAWHPTPFKLPSVPGGPVEYLPSSGAPEIEPGRLLACEPPRLLAYTWGPDELRFTLRASGEGCLLTLEHSFDDRFKAARDGAGWHLCLGALEAVLDGRAVPGVEPGERLPGGWQELNAGYQERFGIAPQDATPPPQM
jgi:uncharacterized protein YndB with AHSA1/START domain